MPHGGHGGSTPRNPNGIDQNARSPLAASLREDRGFQLLARALPDALFVVGEGGQIAYASEKAEPLLGHPPEALEGRPFREIVHPDDLSGLPERFDAVRGGSWDARIVAPDGEERWTNISLMDPGLALDAEDVVVLVRPIHERLVPRDRTTLYREALDATNNLIVVTDPCLPDNPIVFANANFLEATGYERSEIVGQNCRFLQYRPDGTRDTEQPGYDDAPGLDALREAIERGEPARVVLRNYRKSGELFYNELFLTPVHDDDGRSVAFVGVQNDITKRVEAEASLAGQNSLLGAFYEGGALMMGVVEFEGGDVVHRSANARARAFFGVDAVDGTTPEALGFTAEADALWRRRLRECCQGGAPVTFETWYPWGARGDRDGDRHLRIIVSPIDEVGSGVFAYVMEDRTGAYRTDLGRRQLSAAVESLTDPVIVTDAELDRPGPRIVYVNPAYTEVFGYEADEVIGETPRITQGPATDRAVLRRLRARMEAGETARGEVVNYRKDGTPFLLQWEISPVRDASGEVVNYVATMRDVTGHRRLARAVHEATAREQERMARELHDGLGQILAGTRYALTASASALAAEGHPEAETVSSAANRIGEALDQARSIAHGLLPTNLEGRALPEALRQIAESVREAYGIACEVEGAVEVPSETRTHHLYRIAQEAVGNAVRHGNPTRIAIRLSARGTRGYAAELAIEDDGAGMAPETASGDGIGLRSMRFRAQAVGGVLEIEPRAGGGTVVRCLFDPSPAISAEAAADLEAVAGDD